MNKANDKITEQLKKHNNVLLYKRELYECYKKRDKTIKAIYIISPKKGKTAIEQILRTIDKKSETKNKTISKLLEEITEKSKDTQTHIYLDHFEQLSKRELSYYKELSQIQSIQIIANIREDEEVIEPEFLNHFIILDKNGFNDNRYQSVNITYSLLLLLSLLVFITFIRVQLSILHYLVNALWFTLLMYRTFYYITR